MNTVTKDTNLKQLIFFEKNKKIVVVVVVLLQSRGLWPLPGAEQQ
jgi:hypothetical protein